MTLIQDLEALAHELECDPTYNFKGLMSADGDLYQDKLNRIRAAIDLFTTLILTDSNNNFSNIVSIHAAAYGLDHVEIITQSEEEKELGIKSRRRIYTEEV